MKLYYVLFISGIEVFGHTTVGESYDEVFGREIKLLREKYGNAIDEIIVKEIAHSNGYKVMLEKMDTTDFPFIAGRKGKEIW